MHVCGNQHVHTHIISPRRRVYTPPNYSEKQQLMTSGRPNRVLKGSTYPICGVHGSKNRQWYGSSNRTPQTLGTWTLLAKRFLHLEHSSATWGTYGGPQNLGDSEPEGVPTSAPVNILGKPEHGSHTRTAQISASTRNKKHPQC